ncbi:MAG: hypothetical protein PF904_11225 [Kiritimatiellae bacterium]|jgi:hypothetical protein|nr:hypothetical protein [Kiritimatiellia bacterium]
MKQSYCKYHHVLLCAAVSLFFIGGELYGQSRRLSKLNASKRNSPDRIEIERMPPPNKTSVIRTPEFDYNVQNTMPKVTRKPREWALFEIKYSTSAKWTDELTFNYHVMTRGEDEEGNEIYNYYTTTVRYIDIPKGDHMSCVAIAPSQVERYGKPVALALEIVDKNGEVRDSKSEITINLPDEWWKNSKVLDNPKLKRRQGLVDRSKTPFALINIDDYEVVQ